MGDTLVLGRQVEIGDVRRIDAAAIARPALQPGEELLDRAQDVVRGRLADRLTGPPRLGSEQGALEGQCLVLVEGREILEAGVGFEAVDRVPHLFDRRGRALPRVLQVDDIIAPHAIVLRVAARRTHITLPSHCSAWGRNALSSVRPSVLGR